MTDMQKDAMRRAKNAYRREWSRKNPEKVRAAQEKYWLKKAAELSDIVKNGPEPPKEVD